ncbi:uncharacterized protein TNCV_186531 [Trichonephila clavipes]|nr:uncharacterized protein TNCV_186531 [Trichonephila clavipes]
MKYRFTKTIQCYISILKTTRLTYKADLDRLATGGAVAAVAEWYRYRIVACLVTSSSPVPLKTRRVGQRCTLNLSRAETSYRWCGVVVRRGGCQLRCRPRHLTMVQNYVVPTRGLLATDHVILNHGQVTWTTPELAPPLLTPTPYQREDVSALDRFSVHRCPTRRVFSGTGLELVTRQATVRYPNHWATAAPVKFQSPPVDVVWSFGEGMPAQVSSTSLDHGSK